MSPGVARAIGVVVVLLVLGLLGCVIGYQWWVNHQQVVVLSFDVMFFASKSAVSAPVLISICLGIGFVLGLVLPLSMAARLSRKNRLLQQQLALVSPPGAPDRGKDW